VYSKVLLHFSHNAYVIVPMTEPSVKKSDTVDRETPSTMTPLDLTKKPPRSPREHLAGLVMLPRMIDIARARLPGGEIGDYQIGRGISGVVLKHFRLTADEFVGIVAQAADDDEVVSRLPARPGQADHSKLSSRLQGLTVADVPDDLRPEFQAFYGKNLPANRLVLDVLDEDDARSFPRKG
jgi:Domain of unknown function (DUF5069)